MFLAVCWDGDKVVLGDVSTVVWMDPNVEHPEQESASSFICFSEKSEGDGFLFLPYTQNVCKDLRQSSKVKIESMYTLHYRDSNLSHICTHHIYSHKKGSSSFYAKNRSYIKYYPIN